MTDHAPDSGKNIALRNNLRDCAHNAVLLNALLEGIGALDNEGQNPNALTAMIEIATERARALADDLQRAA